MDENAAMVHLLRRQAWEQIEAEDPALVPVIRAGVAAGRSVAAILDDCRAIEADPDVLAGAEMAIQFLREEQFQAILRRAERPEERVSRGVRIETD